MENTKLIDLSERGKLLSPDEAASQLGLKNKDTLAVWRTTKRYDLPYIKVGRLVRYRREDVQGFLNQNRVGGLSDEHK